VFFGQGGYDWETIYNMPIWLRKFTYNKISEHYKAQNEQTANATKGRNSNKTTLIDSSGNVNKEEARKFNPQKVQYK